VIAYFVVILPFGAYPVIGYKKPIAFLPAFLLLAIAGPVPFAGADERRLTPSVALEQEYTDNLFFSAQTQESDFITTVSPALELINNTERLQAGMKMRLDSAYYYDNRNLDRIDQDYSGSLRYAVSPTASLFTSAGYRRDSRVDRDFAQTGFLLGAVGRDRYNYRLGGDYALSEVMGVQVRYGFDRDFYASPVYPDHKSHDLALSINRDLSLFIPRTVGRLNLGVTTFDSADSRATNYTGTIGGERSLDERFSIFADAGLRYTRSVFNSVELVPTAVPLVFRAVPHEEHTDGVGISGQAGLSCQGELSTAKLAFSHGVTAASGRNGTVERTALRCDLERRLNETSRVAFSAQYAVNKSTENELAAVGIDERSLWLQPKVIYAFTEQVAVEASYNHALVNNREADTTAERNLVLLRLVLQYPLFE
jgi:hypothetical protein